MAGKSHPRREEFQSGNSRTGGRRSRARPFNADHYPLWRRRPLRLGRRKPAAHGLQKREVHGWRFQSMESSCVADGEIGKRLMRVILPTEGLVMAETALPHHLGDGPSDNEPARLDG